MANKLIKKQTQITLPIFEIISLLFFFIYLIQPLNSTFDQYIYQDVCEKKSWTDSKQCLICRLKFFCSNFPKFQMNILLNALCLLIKVKIKVINAIFNWYRMMTLFLTFVFRPRKQRRCVWTTIFGVFVVEMNEIYAFRLNYKHDLLHNWNSNELKLSIFKWIKTCFASIRNIFHLFIFQENVFNSRNSVVIHQSN